MKNLSYKITKYPRSRLSKREVDRTIRKAFNVWERATGLTFEEKNAGKVHIEIRFLDNINHEKNYKVSFLKV